MAGLGRGLSQGADILSRGMAEDRQAARDAERERRREEAELRREASIERRWSADRKDRNSQFEATRSDRNNQFEATREDTKDYREQMLGIQDRQVSLTEEKDRRGVVESGIDKVDQEYTATKTATIRFYEGRRKEIQEALEAGINITPEQKALYEQQLKALDGQLANSLATLDKDYTAALNKAVDTYGEDGTKGTKWEPYRAGLMQYDATLADQVGQQIQSDMLRYGNAGDYNGPVPGYTPTPYPKIGTTR